jgi:adenosylcobinamide-GDP ribazoletransferase
MAGSFLTVLPFPAGPFGAGARAAGVALFPLVGGALGLGLGGLGLALDRALPPAVTAALLLAVGALVTGGLHLDGLMDAADGVFGGRTLERRLEIMRDSRVGSFGVLAGVLMLLVQFACLSELAGARRLVALVAALGLSRWALTLALRIFSPARSSGLGASLKGDASWGALAAASLLAVGLAAATGVVGVVGLVGTLGIVVGVGHYFVRRLGGLTGDTYGALAVLVETWVLVTAIGSLGSR